MPKADLRATKDDISGDTIAEAVAVTRSLAEARAGSSSKSTANTQKVIFNGFFPTDENHETAFDAAKHLEEHKKQVDAKRAKEREVNASEYVHFLRCRQFNTHPEGWPTHGVYFTGRPEGVVTDADWYAGYKKTNEVWRNAIYCQVCLRAGREVPLDVEMVNWRKGEWRPDRRWVMKVPRDPKRAAVEGESRAFSLPGESNNLHIDDAHQRWAKSQIQGVNSNG